LADRGLKDAMPFNLPPPWNPGFALPDNVDDEGLERRAFITKMLPRGSYDPSTDGTGGFAVPQYIRDEGTGQGTFTTTWQPGGTYSGPRIPHFLNRRPKLVKASKLPGGATLATVQAPAMGDDEAPMPGAMENYGIQAAQVLISSVAAVPASKRAAALRTAMGKIDASLWSRTSDIFNKYVKQGVAPSDAFRQALQRALSTGLTAAVIKKGHRSGAPQSSPLQGLGCYSCVAALGAVKEGGPGTRDGGAKSPAPKSTTTAAEYAKIVQDALAKGAYYDSNGILRMPIKDSFLDTIVSVVTTPTTVVGGAITGGIATAGGAVKDAGQAVVDAGKAVGGAVKEAADTTIDMAGRAVVNAAGQVVDWVVTASGAVYDAGGTLIGWVRTAAGAIYDAAGTLIGWIVDGAEKLGDLACDAINVPIVGTAVGAVATVVGGVYGGPAGAAAGQVGTQIARKECAVGPSAPVPAPPQSFFSTPTGRSVVVAGLAAAAVLLLLPKKKKPKPATTAVKPVTP
jgi:hypothetical protein